MNIYYSLSAVRRSALHLLAYNLSKSISKLAYNCHSVIFSIITHLLILNYLLQRLSLSDTVCSDRTNSWPFESVELEQRQDGCMAVTWNHKRMDVTVVASKVSGCADGVLYLWCHCMDCCRLLYWGRVFRRHNRKL